ncbi:hypothetical protein A3Q56_08450 [Intoshia linei]|uniref:Uncharacterized protein n=1 Tax=Intoshia linei TaxID=1819745 RepID=A0A177AR45_9BILA|nr:hypothetical protein A3Q56_08450 [Intoshia linei]
MNGWLEFLIDKKFEQNSQEFTNMDEWIHLEYDITNSDYIRYTVLIDKLKSMIPRICPNSLSNIYSIENEFHEKLLKKKRQRKIFEYYSFV